MEQWKGDQVSVSIYKNNKAVDQLKFRTISKIHNYRS